MKATALVAPFAFVVMGACGGNPAADPKTPEPASAAAAPDAEAKPVKAVQVPMEARSGSTLSGTARFEAVEGGVRITLRLTGVDPGHHGAHIHQKADCRAPDGTSAGDHFNPDSHDHGMPPAGARHLGDLGNIEIDASGKGDLEILIEGANLEPGDARSFLERAIVVHAKKDDGGQPTGNAGARIGCGEIKG